MKELKNYLHLYLGCQCVTPDGVMILNGLNINDSRNKVWFYCRWDDKKNCYLPKQNAEILGKQSLVGKSYKLTKIKPILRPLSNMTEEEAIELFKMLSLYDLEDCVFDFIEDESSFCINAELNGIVIDAMEVRVSDFPIISMMNNDGSFSPVSNIQDVFMFLLSKHFDLFGLIESGLAIDSTTLKTAKP